jgi:hypothetical protein
MTSTNAIDPELVFVVDITSFTGSGFATETLFEGKEIAIEFDGKSEGAFLTTDLAKRLKAKRGSRLTLVMEDDSTKVIEVLLAGIGKAMRISDADVYFALGREGGAVIHIRKSN